MGALTTEKAATGPAAAPGTYQVQLKVGDQVETQTFELKADPRVTTGQADFDKQFALWQKIRDKVSETHEGINRLRRIRSQVTALADNLKAAGDLNSQTEAIVEAAKAIAETLTAIEIELVSADAKTGNDRLRLPSRLNVKLIGLISVVASADAAPPQQAYDVFEHLSGRADEQLVRLKQVIETDVPAFNKLVKEAEVPAVIG
jgi:hypothetical protein